MILSVVPTGLQQTEPRPKNKEVGIKKKIDELEPTELHR